MSTEPKARPVRPIETDTTAVPVLSEEIGAVLWRGRQWVVTDYGIEGDFQISSTKNRTPYVPSLFGKDILCIFDKKQKRGKLCTLL